MSKIAESDISADFFLNLMKFVTIARKVHVDMLLMQGYFSPLEKYDMSDPYYQPGSPLMFDFCDTLFKDLNCTTYYYTKEEIIAPIKRLTFAAAYLVRRLD